ncbi:MAG: putative AlkP superfamily phosphohydrolase/phosphomutase, partial [Rhodothermales bacterium]
MIRPQGQQGENSRRVFMLQLDAVDQSFIKDNFDQLPNLRQVFENGQFVSTRSTSKLLEASAWASFASASDPGVHGQYFPLQWDPKTMSMRRATDPHWGARLDYEPFWYELGRDGYRCVVFDANEIFEHKNPPVLEISNWSSQESGKVFSSDPFTLQELNRRFGRRPIGKEVPIRKSIRLSTRLRDGLVDSVRRKCDAIIWLSDQRPWDFYVACVYDLHRAGHNLWPSASKEHSSSLPDAALLDVFKAFDAKLKEILDHIGTPATAVIIYTLHGMAENQSQNHLMPEIMRR